MLESGVRRPRAGRRLIASIEIGHVGRRGRFQAVYAFEARDWVCRLLSGRDVKGAMRIGSPAGLLAGKANIRRAWLTKPGHPTLCKATSFSLVTHTRGYTCYTDGKVLLQYKAPPEFLHLGQRIYRIHIREYHLDRGSPCPEYNSV